MAKLGAPIKYHASMPDRALELCRDCGLTDKQLSRAFGATEATLNLWKKKYPELFESIKKGRELYDDATVEKTLLRRALGYEVKEKTSIPVEVEAEDGSRRIEKKVVKIVTKEVIPDVTAQIFWLKNRQPKKWRDKTEIEHSVSDSLAEKLLEARKRAGIDGPKK